MNPSVYANSMLAYLNCRKSIEGEPQDGDTMLVEFAQEVTGESRSQDVSYFLHLGRALHKC